MKVQQKTWSDCIVTQFTVMDQYITISLKVKEKWLNKIIEIGGLSKEQLVSKIKRSFWLSPGVFYHLYYKNEQHHIVTISSDNLAIELNCSRKYYLEPTQNKSYHWLSHSDQTHEHQSSIKDRIEAVKEQLIEDLAIFGRKLEEEAAKQIQSKMLAIEAKLDIESTNQSTRSGLYCQGTACEDKDIRGYRFQCFVCPNFNLCQKCEGSHHYQHNETHPLIKIKNQKQAAFLHKQNTRQEGKKKAQQMETKRVDSQQHFMEVTGSSSQVYKSLRSRYRLATVRELINFYYQGNK